MTLAMVDIEANYIRQFTIHTRQAHLGFMARPW